MIAADDALSLLVRIAAPLVWRRDAKIAAKLEEFAKTEAGSALDMLKAAELANDPRMRRLFFRHALDEARHAELFKRAARRVHPEPERRLSAYASIHARRQNLFRRWPLERFLAFVHLAERRGEVQFRVLSRRLADRPELAELFRRIARDERFHVRYSRRLLVEHCASERAAKRALALAELERAWSLWRRLGRRIGDVLAHVMLGALYLLVLPPFAIAQRLLEPERVGWRAGRKTMTTIDQARRQF